MENFELTNPVGAEKFPLMKDTDTFRMTGEASFQLRAQDGTMADVEFLYAEGSAAAPHLLGDRFCGAGIYRLDYYKGSDAEVVPLWVAVVSEPTKGVVESIVRQVSKLLHSGEYRERDFWPLTREKS